jgi:hypothetical protein
MMSDIMLSAIMLNAVILSAVMLNDITLFVKLIVAIKHLTPSSAFAEHHYTVS